EDPGLIAKPLVDRLLAVPPESRDDALGKFDPSPALGGLGFGERQLAVKFDERMPDEESGSVEIYALPLQSEDLAEPHPGAQRQDEQRLEPVPLGFRQELCHLLLG